MKKNLLMKLVKLNILNNKQNLQKYIISKQ